MASKRIAVYKITRDEDGNKCHRYEVQPAKRGGNPPGVTRITAVTTNRRQQNWIRDALNAAV
jgi:hypothetical protein